MHNHTIGPKVSSRSFGFNRATKEFVAEISMLEHGGANVLGQLYPDSGDIGFVLVSHKTGLEVEFVLKEEARDADRDIKFWSFEPAIHEQHRNAALRGISIVVFND